MLRLNNNLKHGLPGLGYGFAAFAVYVVYDKLTSTEEKHH